MSRKVFIPHAVLFVLVAAASTAEGGADLSQLVLAADAAHIARWSAAPLEMGAEVDHYDGDGYPEDAAGGLVLREHRLGPMVYVKDEDDGRLLYAQFANLQRDAVFLARTGTVRDPLPDGGVFEIPYGYGALKRNESVVSLVEARVVPHFSDNRKSYELFPLSDLYLGVSVGSSGVTASARYVLRETYAGWVRGGANTFARLNQRSILNAYWVPLHVGGGYRVPGVFPQLLGENLITAGAEAFLGLGDRDRDAATAPVVFLPGAVVEFERLLYDTASSREDFRSDPRPYNYRVNSFSVRLGAYLDVPTFRAGGNLVRLLISTGVQWNIVGPRLPEHEFKTTAVRYVHDYYVEDLRTQAERRAAREE